ncbi:unnamed protein product [Durusdinium trenchii]|uniref:Uncharacterized protein n=1 Tax=Durusdinium trenchii TaxID=1381693 RepID=A0ABP0PFQ1_9DINO
MRLQAQLLQTTWEQTRLSIASDISKLKQWSGRWELYVSQQGAMDYKYIADRFERGKVMIGEFMTERHTLISCQNLMLAHASIVEKQASMGPDACLCSICNMKRLKPGV